MKTLVARRRGFTLIELLVVIAIIAVLVGLLLAAVQKAREAGNRVVCANNLHQIAIAFHLHADSYGKFPTGGISYEVPRTMAGNIPADYTTQAWSWGYQILPYIEQQVLWANPSDQEVASTPIPIYFCPTRRRPVALSGGPWQSEPYPRGMTDYAGNAGTSSNGGDGGGIYGNGEDGVVVRGTYTPTVGLSDIPDGTGNTLLVGEKHLNSAFVMSQCQPDDNDGYVGGYQDDVVRWGAFPPLQDHAGPMDDWSNIHPAIFSFGSSHPAGFQAAFCDGSVRMIRFTVAPNVFQLVCSRNDGQVYDPGDL